MAATLAAVFASSTTSTVASAATSGAAAATSGAASGAIGTAAGAAYAAATPSLWSTVSSFAVHNFGLIASGFSAVMQGNAQAASARATSASLSQQADQYALKAKQEELIGLQQSNIIKNRTLRLLASNTARTANSGIDAGSGSSKTIQDELLRQSEEQLSVTRSNSDLASLADQISSGNSTADAGYALDIGTSKVRSTLFQSAAAGYNRGVVYN